MNHVLFVSFPSTNIKKVSICCQHQLGINYILSCKQCSKYRPKVCASLFSIYPEQAFVAGISFPVKCPWNQVFYISIKVLSPCSLALSMAIITMAPNSLIMPTPNITPLPLQTTYRAHAALSWTLAGSPQPPCSQSQSIVCHH